MSWVGSRRHSPEQQAAKQNQIISRYGKCVNLSRTDFVASVVVFGQVSNETNFTVCFVDAEEDWSSTDASYREAHAVERLLQGEVDIM